LYVNHLQGLFVMGAQKGAQFLGFYLQFLDLTYPFYKISEEWEKVKS
jgi:hypothetical protein